MRQDRAVLFVDGNNWFHGLGAIGITDRMRLDYAKISLKLVGPRLWLGTRDYIGRETHNPTFMANQRQFVKQLLATDHRISVHFGRIEKRPADNPLASEMLTYLGKLTTRIDTTVYHDLMKMARQHLR